MEDKQKIPLVFYRTETGNEPVREWLKGLDVADRHSVGLDLMRVQWRWPIGMPLCRAMGGGLWEVRTAAPSRRVDPQCSVGATTLEADGQVGMIQRTALRETRPRPPSSR